MSKQDKKPKDINEALESEDLTIEDTEEIVEEIGKSDKIKKLRDELVETKAKRDEYLAGWQKSRAEFVNFKASEEKLAKDKMDRMKGNLVSDFLQVLDSFDMAMGNTEAWEAVDKNWRIGIESIHSQILGTLAEYGMEEINELKIEFNPEIHEPVEMVEVDEEKDDHKVLEIVQKGYKTGERVIRPAKVKVGELKK